MRSRPAVIVPTSACLVLLVLLTVAGPMSLTWLFELPSDGSGAY